MMNIYHRPPSQESLMALAALQAAVTKTLEKKKKLGHYAVVWKNGEVTLNHFDSSSNAPTRAILPAPNLVSLDDGDAEIIRHSDKS